MDATGTGAANDATIEVAEGGEDDKKRAKGEAEEREAALESLRAKVERQREHLTAAEKALAAAEKEGN